MKQPLVSVIVLNWNSGAHLLNAVESVFEQTHQNLEVLLVDNDSSDQSVTPVLARFSSNPRFRLIRNNENHGYCGGMNIGIRASKGEYVLGLNPDVILDRSCVAEMLRAFADKRVGMVAPKAVRSSNSAVIDSAGTICFQHLFATAFRAGQAERGADIPHEVFGVIGAYSMYRRALLDDIAVQGENGVEYFDEEFFTYYDEHDLQIRARWMGWKCWYVPSARARHLWRYSVKSGLIKHGPLYDRAFRNYYLSLVKNLTVGQFLRSLHLFVLHEMGLLALSIIYREPIIITAKLKALPLIPSMLRKRRLVMEKRMITRAQFNLQLAGFWAFFRFLCSVILSEKEDGRLLSFTDSDQVGQPVTSEEEKRRATGA